MATFIQLHSDDWINLDQVVQVQLMADESVRVRFASSIRQADGIQDVNSDSIRLTGSEADGFLRRFRKFIDQAPGA